MRTFACSPSTPMISGSGMITHITITPTLMSTHTHHHDHEHHDHDHSHQPSDAVQRPIASTENLIIGEAILAKNDHLAQHNRDLFAQRGITALNLMSSPGSGKTSLLERTIADLGDASRSVSLRATRKPPLTVTASGGLAPAQFK